MTTPGAHDVQAAFCAVLCEEWARAGVTDAVVAPGSRSTPLVAALDAEAGIRVSVVLDERSAGFTALGIALASGRPALVVTTSGTASVELHPAMVEAGQAGVPMVAVTTDRPPELHHVGAPQTVEQQGLFGPVVRWSADPGVPDLATSATWRSLAARAVAECLAGPSGPGPVHLNLPFREPLIGDASRVAVPPGRPDGRPWHAAGAGRGGVPGEVTDLLAGRAGGRGVVVAGAGAGPAALALAERLAWPLLADPRSGVRLPGSSLVVSTADALLRVPGWAGAARPDTVLRLGSPWASKVIGQWLAGLPAEVPQVLCDPSGRWADPERAAGHVVRADAAALAAALPDGSPPAASWAAAWSEAEIRATEVMDSLLSPGGDLELSEPAVARAALAGVPDGGLLVASSSMPVRDIEWYGAPRRGAVVLSNRGANGIDGVVSTAVGASLASGQPTVALLGDLAFLYDAGALLWAPARPLRLSLVVIDNDGGGIFSFLPQAAALEPDRFERYWGTPHGLDLLRVASAYGVETSAIAERDGLETFLARAARPGVRMAVVRSDRAANVAAHDRLHAAVAAAVDGLEARL